jgi:hypothetical protein
LIAFDTAGSYTTANGKAFQIPADAYSVEIYVIGGGGSSDTQHDTPSNQDNHAVVPATPGATVKRTLDRDAGTLMPEQELEFSIGAGGPDPQNTGMCNVILSNLGQRGEASVLYDPAFPGDSSHILLRAAGGGRGSYCGESGYPQYVVGEDSCLAGDYNECFYDVVDDDESTYDAAFGDDYWRVEHRWMDCLGLSTSAAVQPVGDIAGCGPGAAMVSGRNYEDMAPAKDGAVVFRIVPCATISPS